MEQQDRFPFSFEPVMDLSCRNVGIGSFHFPSPYYFSDRVRNYPVIEFKNSETASANSLGQTRSISIGPFLIMLSLLPGTSLWTFSATTQKGSRVAESTNVGQRTSGNLG